MNILIVNNTLLGGGAEKLIRDMAPEYKKLGHECTVLILTKENEKYMAYLQNNNVHVEVFPEHTNHLKKIRFLYSYIKNGNFDVVHANLFPTIYYVSIVSRLLGNKSPRIVMTEHNTDNRRRHRSWLRPIERVIYSRYDKIISISQMTENNLKQWLQLPKKDDSKFTVISNGVPLNDFKMAHSLEKSEIFNGYKKGDILIGVIGSFTVQKNHRAILDVMEILPYRYKLILVGEGVLAEQIREIAESKNIMNRVTFLGFRKDVASVMKTLDVITVPSLWEGFGLVAVEAMASGTPVVVSNVPGLSDVVSRCGLHANPAKPSDFAKAIRTLESKDEYDKYQKLGIERANDFDINKTIELYLKEFKNE